MAALKGIMESDKSQVSRLSHHVIGSTLKTWDGQIETTLLASGVYKVVVNGKHVATGSVNEE
jgi:aspartyl-tRNA synthetase